MCTYAYSPGNSDSNIFLGILFLLNLEFWLYIEYINEQFVNATPLTLQTTEFHETFVNVLRMQCVDVHITRNFGFYYFFLLIHSRNVIKVYRLVKQLYQFYSNF